MEKRGQKEQQKEKLHLIVRTIGRLPGLVNANFILYVIVKGINTGKELVNINIGKKKKVANIYIHVQCTAYQQYSNLNLKNLL